MRTGSKLEIFFKVASWRVVSMLCGFMITYAITGKPSESAAITVVTGQVLMMVQWGFEIIWEDFVRMRLRNALSEKQGGVDRVVWRGRDARNVSVDKHEQKPDGGEGSKNPLSPENAGREWT
jgi:uncharacterized membrane protein